MKLTRLANVKSIIHQFYMYLSVINYLCKMKRLIFGFCLTIILFSGCDEVPPFIDFSEPGKSTDTSYIVTPSPPAQHKIVLIEDITGVRCVNCPSAAIKIKEIINNKTEDSVISIALYPWPGNTNNLYTLTAPYDGFPIVASDISSQIVESIGIPVGMPNGYVDRNIFAPQTVRYNPVGNWGNLVNMRLKLTTPVNISLKKSVSGKKIAVDVKLQYTESISGTHKFALYLIEDNIISKQATTSGTNDNYIHNHVLRHTFDLAVGKVLTATLVPGRTFEKHYEYEASPDYKIENCYVVCVILNTTTEEVINVRKIALK